MNDPRQWDSIEAHCRCSTYDGEYAAKPENGHKNLGWGASCSHFDKLECGLTPNCDNCRWSWPVDDPTKWASEEATCRCASEVEIRYGSECNNITDELCELKEGNCNSCRWSWDREDPLKWNSESASCRCVEDRYFYRFGWQCSDEQVEAQLQNTGEERQDCDYFTSYPFGDPHMYTSVDAKCRCLPPQRDAADYSYGEKHCVKTTSGACVLDGGCTACHWSWPTADVEDKWNSVEAICRC